MKMEQIENKHGTYDTSILYDLKEYPDIESGRCDNCGSGEFKSKIEKMVFIRMCTKCGMRKSI